MSSSAASKPPTEIAGYPAELVNIDTTVAVAVGEIEGAQIPLYRVARLDEIVDGAELLRSKDSPDPPYWALVWIGARAIAAHLAPSALTGQSVLDLGCGLGLAGVAAGLAGARVMFADCVDEALAFAGASAEHNGLVDHELRRVDFTSDRLTERFDLILAADIVYEPSHYAALVEFLDVHLATNGRLLITESLRADARRVLEMLTSRGYARTSDAVWMMEDDKPERTWLHSVRRAGNTREQRH